MERYKPMETPLVTNRRKVDAASGEEVDATIYQQLVGSLVYLVNTRPHMCYAVNSWAKLWLGRPNYFGRKLIMFYSTLEVFVENFEMIVTQVQLKFPTKEVIVV